MVRTLVSAGELSLSCARLLAGRVTTLWLRHPLSVSQHGQLSLPSLRGRLMSSNPCYSGLRRRIAEGVVRGVASRPRQRVLRAAGWSVGSLLAQGRGTQMSAVPLRCWQWKSPLAIENFVFVFLSRRADRSKSQLKKMMRLRIRSSRCAATHVS